ncbi:C-terminal processing protease CtpA/Prc [Flavobacterium nitrogenifigens]|uniref:C-terminal processing protease CtpA/Prc n=2 Tax=Flavobacterium TaxID=237 RepID=A0A7W7N4U7_9FLAO|nr:MULTISPECIES: S41 family peptidase [Flavobacterium]MBB4799985.1 C-terminal processing protease CtpA/Prc [Flavobacterium nitrogenifigens]MBB6386265.1 C-terminal processing protease CtpA/Prc [Flavobacterium notoginsengisoli]
MMRKKIVAVLFICFFMPLAFSQNISVVKLNENEVQRMASLCKIWGFLKYYHPNVAKGNFNWDEQLFLMIPKVLKSENKEELSKVYLNWIADLGEVKACKSCNAADKKESFDENFDLSWIQNTNLYTEELTSKLKYIENNRSQGSNKYVKFATNDNVEIQNEIQYPNFEYPEQNVRLLGLFRYWNVVEYFFPYKYQMDQKWDAVLIEMIPRFLEAKNTIEYQLAISETIMKLDDSHATFYSKEISDFFGRKHIPATFKIIDNKVVIDGFYDESLSKTSDIRIGDVVEKVNGKKVIDIFNENAKYINGSNLNVKMKNAYAFIFNGSTDSVKVTLNRNGVISEKNWARYYFKDFKIKEDTGEKYKILEGNIGYADMNLLEMKDVDKMMTDFKNTKAIIIDYRGPFMNFMPFLIARRFIKNEKIFARVIQPDLSYPGHFFEKKPKTITPMSGKYYSGKVIILVNSNTQSSSEYSTMMFQAGDNVTTIGSQTSGADGDVSEIEFVGFKSKMSGLGVFYPNKSETQRKGLKIDIEANPTIKGIQEGKDEVLQKAIEFIAK